MRGLIFNINRYSINDGPGIRVTFFMKGCPLSCWWCHNPEGISPDIQEIKLIEKVGEREFVKDKEVGKYYMVEEILEILSRERIFMDESGGGVTFSGGEPLMQPDFLTESLKQCHENGYHTAVDTSGFVPAANLLKIFPYTDLFLYDFKHPESRYHLSYTGVENELIMSNLRLILAAGKNTIIRIPVIPGINDDENCLASMKKIIEELNCLNLMKINLLPYHKTGIAKYENFRIPSKGKELQQPTSAKMLEIQEYLAESGIEVAIVA